MIFVMKLNTCWGGDFIICCVWLRLFSWMYSSVDFICVHLYFMAPSKIYCGTLLGSWCHLFCCDVQILPQTLLRGRYSGSKYKYVQMASCLLLNLASEHSRHKLSTTVVLPPVLSCIYLFVCFLVRFFFARRPAMLGLIGFSGSLPLYVVHRFCIFVC